jgi:hypothetical protein
MKTKDHSSLVIAAVAAPNPRLDDLFSPAVSRFRFTGILR